ncbi:unnamed protein product [Diplocarpon coronariae]
MHTILHYQHPAPGQRQGKLPGEMLPCDGSLLTVCSPLEVLYTLPHSQQPSVNTKASNRPVPALAEREPGRDSSLVYLSISTCKYTEGRAVEPKYGSVLVRSWLL